jgi:hypothetical protein
MAHHLHSSLAGASSLPRLQEAVIPEQSDHSLLDRTASLPLLSEPFSDVLQAPAPSTSKSGFFQGASQVNASHGVFNDVTGIQLNFNANPVSVKMVCESFGLLIARFQLVCSTGERYIYIHQT